MNREAAETEERYLAVAAERDGKKTTIEAKAREQEAAEMMRTYLGDATSSRCARPRCASLRRK